MLPPKLLDFYDVLGVPRTATSSEIKDAYRLRAKELHPDKNRAADATARFQQLQEAYSVLGSPERRALYDSGNVTAAVDPATKATEVVFDPIPCAGCGAISAQPRFIQYNRVISVIFASYKVRPAGVFCPSCASKRMFFSTLVTGSIGWLSFWGFFWSLEALFRNLTGASKPPGTNAFILAKQAGYFMQQGRPDLASALASESLTCFTGCHSGMNDYSLGKIGADFSESILKHPRCKRVHVRTRWSGWSVPSRFAMAGFAIPAVFWGAVMASSRASSPGRSTPTYVASTAANSAPGYVPSYASNPIPRKPPYVTVTGPYGAIYHLIESDWKTEQPIYEALRADDNSLTTRETDLDSRGTALETRRTTLDSSNSYSVDDFNNSVNQWNADSRQLKSDLAQHQQQIRDYDNSLQAMDKTHL